tara:strand:+ start:11606 stop:12403 length:798 start_codon:yes stop_codon:yes gene_type:complete
MIKKIINKILKYIGDYEIRKIIPKEFSDLKLRDLETAYKILNLLRTSIEVKEYKKYYEFYKFCIERREESNSQNFQDLFICWKLKNQRHGVFVEFGADDGILNSNSFLLEKKFGWSGLLVEPNPYIQKVLRKNRACNIANYIISSKSNKGIKFESRKDRQQSEVYKGGNILSNSKIFKIESITLNDLLEKNKIKKAFELLSIDVEGNELEVLKGFDLKYWEPMMIIIEHNYDKDKMRKITKIFEERGYKKELELFSFHDFWFTNF